MSWLKRGLLAVLVCVLAGEAGATCPTVNIYPFTTGCTLPAASLNSAFAARALLISPSFTTPTLGAALATSINGNAITSGTGTLTLGAGKTATLSNTLTFTGTDGSTLAIGGGGTLGSMAYQAASAVAITGGTAAGLTGLAIRDTSAAFDLTIAATSSTALNAGRILTLDMKNVAHTLAFGATANTIDFTPGANGNILTSNGTSWSSAAPPGGGSGCTVSGAAGIVQNDGANGCTTDASITASAGALSLGSTGVAGSAKFGNATSGTITLQPVTGALGSVTLSMPAAADTLVGKATTDTLTNKTLTSPTMTAPVLGTPASGTLTNATGLPISTGVSGLGTGVATALATPSSANIAAAVTDETGSGALVFATSPTFVTPALGTPGSGVATNLTGTAAGLTAGNVTTNANLTGPVTSSGNATAFATMTANALLTGNGTALPNQVAITGLVKGNGASAPAAYAGASCTNQFPRALDANGAATCASVANADLAGSIAASKLVGTDIATVGTITAGTWTGTTVAVANGGTGATSLAGNGAVIMNSGGTAQSVVAPSTTGNVLTSNGTAWTSTALPAATLAPGAVSIQKFTATGTYTPVAGISYATAECVGGGGGGGGSAISTGLGAGGGGAAGSHSLVRLTAAQIGASQAVTIPTAAAGGATGNNNGTVGGDVSLGSLLICKGGGFGAGAAANGIGAGGAGTAGSTGDLVGVGMAGSDGLGGSATTVEGLGGIGGSTLWGGSPLVAASNTNCADGRDAVATAYGAGGGGGTCSNNGSSTAAGGAGAKGAILITEYVFGVGTFANEPAFVKAVSASSAMRSFGGI